MAWTRKEKFEIASEVIGGTLRQRDAVEKHNVPPSTLCGWIKAVKKGSLTGTKLDSLRQRAKVGVYTDIEAELVKYISLKLQKQEGTAVPFSWLMLKDKAHQIAKSLAEKHPEKAQRYLRFRASSGWFQNVKKRHNINGIKLRNEGLDECQITSPAPTARQVRHALDVLDRFLSSKVDMRSEKEHLAKLRVSLEQRLLVLNKTRKRNDAIQHDKT